MSKRKDIERTDFGESLEDWHRKHDSKQETNMKTLQDQLDDAIARNHVLEEDKIELEQYINQLQDDIQELLSKAGE